MVNFPAAICLLFICLYVIGIMFVFVNPIFSPQNNTCCLASVSSTIAISSSSKKFAFLFCKVLIVKQMPSCLSEFEIYRPQVCTLQMGQMVYDQYSLWIKRKSTIKNDLRTKFKCEHEKKILGNVPHDLTTCQIKTSHFKYTETLMQSEKFVLQRPNRMIHTLFV